MRILFLTSEYPQPSVECGGVGSYVASTGPVLVERGHEVHVLSCLENQGNKDYVDRGVFIHSRPKIRFPGHERINRVLRTPTTIASFQSGLSNFVEYCRLGLDFDVIEYPDLDAEGWVFALLRMKPLVAHLHLPILLWYPGNDRIIDYRDMHWASTLEKFAARKADVITCPSKLLMRKLKEKSWLEDRDPIVIPPFVSWSDWLSTRPVENTEPIVLSLGWLGVNKAPELLVEAISIVRRKLSNAKALFLGTSQDSRDGLPYLEWIKNSAADLSGCEFAGYIPHHRVIQYISSSRVLAIPSWFESYSLAALEAMASGRPVIVTETTGVAELVEKTGAGRVIPPGDPKALAEALMPFLMDAAYAAEVGQRARVAIRDQVDPDKIAKQRETAYQNAILAFKRGLRRKFRKFLKVKGRKGRIISDDKVQNGSRNNLN